tara:strand:+ start:1622 stop:1849 length:228 start_codon:yes stop_codon:yes gene_type:complete
MDRIMSIFSLQGVVDTLTAEGIDAGKHRINHAISRGYVSRPKLVGGNRVYTAKHLGELRKYLVNAPSPERQPAAV